MKRFAFLAVAFVAALSASPAQAANLEWKDLSFVLPARNNRPVWDVAYANPYVYYTDGHAFAKGGFFARTDGQWTKNLTKEVKSLGFERVDKLKYEGNRLKLQQFWPINTVQQEYAYPHEWNLIKAPPAYSMEIRNGVCTLVSMGGKYPPYYYPLPTGAAKKCHETLMAYNGQHMYVLTDHKNLYRVDGMNFVSLGRVNDYFTSMTSDARGTIYFGGAVSKKEKDQPTLPLTAKLMKMTDPSVVASLTATSPSPSPAPAPTQPSKTSTWTWTAPTVTSLPKDGWTTYHVGAWNPAGIKTIEIYRNDTIAHLCSSATQTVECGTGMSPKDTDVGSDMVLKGKITDASGGITWTDITKVRITPATGTITLDPSVDISVANEFVPASTRIGRNGSVVLRISAQAKAGLKRVVVWANGTQRSACSFSNAIGYQTCDFQVNGWEYPYGQTLTITTQAIDAGDHEAWAGVHTLLISDELNGGISSNTSFWTTVNGNLFIAGANDPDGISRIEVYVNNSLRETCTFPGSYGSRECMTSLNSTDFISGVARLKGKIIDVYGNTAWTDTKTVSK